MSPFFELTKLPGSFLFILLFSINNATEAVLHAVYPLTAVLATIGVSVGSLSMFFVELIVAFIFAPILPDIAAKSVHDSVLEGALKVSAIGPLETPVATHLVIRPDASVLASIGPKVDAFALFYSVLEKAVIVAAIAPHFDAFAILLLHRCHF